MPDTPNVNGPDIVILSPVGSKLPLVMGALLTVWDIGLLVLKKNRDFICRWR